MRLSRYLMIAALMGLAAAPLELHAQANSPTSAQTRQARLKEHEKKIREIIEQRRKEAQAAEATATPALAVEAAPAAAEAPPPEEEAKKAVSNVVMGFKFTNDAGVSDYNIIVRNGQTFLSEVFLFNIDGNPIDQIRLALDYDKRFIQPIRVFDANIRERVEGGEPEFTVDDREAIISYKANLTKPLEDREVVMLRILWKAVRPTPYTGIEFHFDPLERDGEYHTAMYADGKNILGTNDDPMDGVLSGGLMIDIPEGADPILQGKAEELKELYLGSIASRETVGLQLFGPTKPPAVGEAFKVTMRLNNPDGALVDSLNTFVKFDPNVLEVIDVDKFNWVNRGINIHDGPYHRTFPWDMLKRNEVRNDRGFINYQKSLTNGASLPSKTVADIYFRAKAPTERTEIYFVKGKLSESANTSIRYFGYERLELDSEKSISAVVLPVLPAPEVIAGAEAPVGATEVTQAEQSGVRSLKIDRTVQE